MTMSSSSSISSGVNVRTTKTSKAFLFTPDEHETKTMMCSSSSRTNAILSASIKSDNTAPTTCSIWNSNGVGSDVSIESNFSLEHEAAVAGNHDGRSRSNAAQHRSVRVSFDRIEVREYPVRLGDHPDCSSGPPITIGWDHVRERTCSVDEYETDRLPRKCLSQLKLSYFERKSRLRSVACSDKDIRDAITQVQQVQMEREESNKVPMFGSLKRAFKKLRLRKRSSSS
mmetsp:Transcript_33470/g.48474  ORF Transcript_33470/g.48474 Transcript_33470/m.48474 type:complete len:228 (-) Transcript_33470:103-786(-)